MIKGLRTYFLYMGLWLTLERHSSADEEGFDAAEERRRVSRASQSGTRTHTERTHRAHAHAYGN